MLQNNIKPRYEVERIDETITEKRIIRHPEKDGIPAYNEEKDVEVAYGYNVYFPAGHSIRVRDDAELARLGFDKPAELIDNDGDVVGSTAQASLKRSVKQRTAASKRSPAHTTAVDASQGD